MSSVDGLLAQLAAMNVSLSVEDEHLVFDAPDGVLTPAHMEQIRQHRSELIKHPQVTCAGRRRFGFVRQAAPGEVIPLSFAQERLWFLERLGVGAAYNESMALSFKGRLDTAALECSIEELVRRHEILRTHFEEREGYPYQVVTDCETCHLDVQEISLRESSARPSVVRAALAQEIAHRFTLSTGPLFHARLLRFDDHDHVLLVTAHHIICDGWSLEVMRREIRALYESHRARRPSALARLPVQYSDYARWQRQRLQGDELQKPLAYWRRQLDGIEQLQLPTDRMRPAIPTFGGALVPFSLSEDLSTRLASLARAQGVTPFMLLLAAFQALLAHLSGQQDIVVGSPIAGRTHRHFEDLIGFFVNMLALRTRVSGDCTFVGLLQQVKGVALGAYEHQHLPFEKLVAELQPERDLSRQTIFQVIFAWQTFAQEFVQVTSKFDLSLYMHPTPEGWEGVFEYATDLFDVSTVERLAGYWINLLERIANNPNSLVWRIPLLSDAERHQALRVWNSSDRDRDAAPLARCHVHELLERQAAKTPHAIAVLYEDSALSYARLNRRANQLAHYLRTLNVSPEQRVAVCMHRSFDLIVALIGILKTGGAYVPLDPSYPAERLTFMICDSGAMVLLSHSELQDVLSTLPMSELDIPLIMVDGQDVHEVIAQQSEENLDARVLGLSADHLAYVIYTSGSTGLPKAVGNSIGGLQNRLSWFVQSILPSPAQTAWKTSIGFVDSVTEMLQTLLAGADAEADGPRRRRC
ncbi:hypothetical protein GCM10011487_54140 [Steroidobacter agaridevorans]|uniref:Non-ribosomal peptide synthetase n=1 Tax=Steroidobacter agaridevorans TaxID=2695856 RepID=A0A829YJ69_9GAMM|nr:condensation domain-containing protein [Steroidobacter agaridevorans]GFE83414.1 hypothetical protein GCM10011487_54140 [Steroidobacter agaridevorans]